MKCASPAEPDLTIEFQDFPLERLEFSILLQMKKNISDPADRSRLEGSYRHTMTYYYCIVTYSSTQKDRDVFSGLYIHLVFPGAQLLYLF